MPIKGLTDRGLSFAQIGVIRKGAPKTGNAPGKDLQYFRVEFDEAEQESAARFKEVYGDQPKEIRVVFPFDDIDQIAQFWYEAYTAGRMVARSDGEFFEYLIDTKTGEVLVKNGKDKNGNQVPCNPEVPVGYYKDTRNKEQPIMLKGTGRIRVVVPELRRYAYLLLLTTSIHDIRNLSEQIRGIYESNRHKIAGIRFILKRKPRKVSCPMPGDPTRRARLTKHMLSIEPDPEWVEGKLLAMQKQSMQFEAPAPRMQMTAASVTHLETQVSAPDEDWVNTPVVEEFAEDEDDNMPPQDGEFYEEIIEDRQPEESMVGAAMNMGGQVTESQPEQPAIPPLRCQPEQLKARLVATAKANTEALTNGKKGTVINVLEACLSHTTDPKASRKQLLVFLFGKDSTNDLTDNEVMALYKWLAPHKDEVSGEWFADSMAAREAVAAFNAAQPKQEGLF